MPTRIHQLIINRLKGKTTPEERNELDEFTARSPENKEVVDNLTDPRQLMEMIRISRELDVDAAWQRISGPPPARVVQIRLYAAAIAVIIIVYLAWLFLPWKPKKQTDDVVVKTESNQFYVATLKRSNGQQLQLHNLKNGHLEGAPELIKDDHQLSYPVNRSGLSPGIDTLETFQKSYYSIQLPDSSIAWINCASTLLFPNSFSGTERVVQLEGEAYFEIAKDATRPFRVQVKGMEVQVTGTRFNVKANKRDGIVSTTVLDGSVKVIATNRTDILKPGDQARLTSNGKFEKIKLDSAEKKTAWLDNQWKWEEEELKIVIEDICRWYGLAPVYKDPVPSITLSANINRSKPLSEVLGILEKTTPLKFKIIGSSMWIGIR